MLLMVQYQAFLVIYKNEEDPIKNEGAIVFTTLCIDFSDAQGQLNTLVSGWISLK